MGGEEQKRVHVENVKQHPAEKREIRDRHKDKDMGSNRRMGGPKEE